MGINIYCEISSYIHTVTFHEPCTFNMQWTMFRMGCLSFECSKRHFSCISPAFWGPAIVFVYILALLHFFGLLSISSIWWWSTALRRAVLHECVHKNIPAGCRFLFQTRTQSSNDINLENKILRAIQFCLSLFVFVIAYGRENAYAALPLNHLLSWHRSKFSVAHSAGYKYLCFFTSLFILFVHFICFCFRWVFLLLFFHMYEQELHPGDGREKRTLFP